MLTEKELEVLRVLINTIIPADDFPSAWDAGVGDYLLHQFNGDLQGCLSDYQVGLSALDTEAQAIHSKPFANLAADEQTNLLTNIEIGNVHTEWKIDPMMFFAVVVGHCMEGYYSNPKNRGNRDAVAWQMIGFELRG